MVKLTLFWLFVSIFAVTALITLLGITGVIKTIKDRYLNALFTALILEVIAAVFLVFQGFNFEESTLNLGAMISQSGLEPPVEEDEREKFVIDKLAQTLEFERIKEENATLKLQLSGKLAELDKIRADFDQFDQSFYANITRLDNAMDNYFGRSINIGFEPEKKEAVYVLLVEIFGELGAIRDGDAVFSEDNKVNKLLVRKIYTGFRQSYGREVLNETSVYIDEFDMSQMVKSYLERRKEG